MAMVTVVWFDGVSFQRCKEEVAKEDQETGKSKRWEGGRWQFLFKFINFFNVRGYPSKTTKGDLVKIFTHTHAHTIENLWNLHMWLYSVPPFPGVWLSRASGQARNACERKWSRHHIEREDPDGSFWKHDEKDAASRLIHELYEKQKGSKRCSFENMGLFVICFDQPDAFRKKLFVNPKTSFKKLTLDDPAGKMLPKK